ncbi:hypothetical protein [Flavobacterium sp.]|uniref:hypothetical protein n=1 Tax=Flavobacterium sp. TaxID=239 RepID=UPI00286C6FB6|nr:hypothetical protein [Flavobacterium sp.]
MKKAILVSMYVVASVAMISCSNDEADYAASKNKSQVTVNADSSGGQSGQTPVPPPK